MRIERDAERVQRTPSPMQNTFGGLLVEAGKRISDVGQKALADAGLGHLSFGRIGVLSFLLESQGTQAELCRALRQKPPSMGELLQRLEKEGLVKSSADPDDRRRTHWSLTAKGRRDITKARTVFRKSGERIDRAFDALGVSSKELRRFKEVLSGLLEMEGVGSDGGTAGQLMS